MIGLTAGDNSRKLSEDELIRYGQELAENLSPGSVVALYGDLGSGKTTLAAAIAAGLGVAERVTSPTFTIIGEYVSGHLPLYHFDVYRLGSAAAEEMEELGYLEYFAGEGVSIVEWADLIEELLPPHTMRIYLDYADEGQTRMLSLK